MKIQVQKDYIFERKSELFSYINYWKRKLDIQHYRISLQRIAENQVCDDDLNTGIEFVGIYTDHKKFKAFLFYTRELRLDDIVHELLHVKYPDWSDDQVTLETEKIIMKIGSPA